MKLVLELTEIQLNDLHSSLFAGIMEAFDYKMDYIKEDLYDKADIWDKIQDRRSNLASYIKTAIELQGMGSEEGGPL